MTPSTENMCEYQFLYFEHSSQLKKFSNTDHKPKGGGALIREGAAIRENTVDACGKLSFLSCTAS